MIKYLSKLLSKRRVTFAGKKFPLYLDDKHEKNYFDCIYNNATDFDILIAKQFLKPGDIVLDAGANIGFSSLVFLNQGAGKVYAFEPVPHLFKRLKILSDERLAVYDSALSDIDGWADIILSETHNQGHTLNPDFTGIFPTVFGAAPKKTRVSVAKLDSVLPKVKFDFFKVDIEGSESKFLDGAKDTLNTNPPRIMMIEIYPNVFEDVHRNCCKYFAHSQRVVICPHTSALKLFSSTTIEEVLIPYIKGPPIYIYSDLDLLA